MSALQETKVICAEAVEEYRRRRRLQKATVKVLPVREVPSENYVYEAGGKRTETVNSKMRRLLESKGF